ncbi:MAG: PolC-type DNA polymerase III [Oscillospiraceae bacterium]|jgi:DNA polymerase-3 subunit alpha (Gram-positive type)|nr:PolC-type DNA polymerase III [Oscillospiraceae bacterium]
MSGEKFYEIFNCCREDNALRAVLEETTVSSVRVDEKYSIIRVTLNLPHAVAPVEIAEIERVIAAEYAPMDVIIKAVYPKTDSVKNALNQRKSVVIMGKKAPSGSITPLDRMDIGLGRVTVRGTVFAVSSRQIPSTGAWVLTFDITDYTGSIRISKFLKPDDSKPERIVNAIKVGMCLTIAGRLEINRYEQNDVTLDPTAISVERVETVTDDAPEKRVELHLHTQMSMMDATTDTAAVVKRAIEWGHPAIAITDHGVVQSFPDAMKAAGDKIKVLYGVEGYFRNDTDSRRAVFGNFADLNEVAVFDIETTGLSAQRDKITEIACVIVKNGEIIDEFETFANPGVPIPRNITELTGITDADVRDAPSQVEAVRAFLNFAGDRPFVAHNATFDIGFIYEVCAENGIDFNPNYIDTLALSRALYPDASGHRLNDVSARLNLPDFNHHRALDDTRTTGLIYARFQAQLRKLGAETPEAVNDYCYSVERQSTSRSRPRLNHIIIFAKTQDGVKNLYRLITDSHLKDFNRNPIITKSQLMKYRDGLLVGSACEAGEVFRAITDGASRLELRRIAEFYDYLEIQPIANNRFMLRGDSPKATSEEQLRDFNRAVVALGRELDKPVVATGDVHFLDPQDEVFRRVLLTAKGFEDATSELPIYFRTTEDMLSEFAYLGEETAYEVVVKNTNLVADMCDKVRPLPPAKTLFAPKIENSAEDLKRLVYTRLRELYGETPPELITTRVETELKDILDRNYDVIYISAQRLVKDSLDHGYLVGSRGSVGSSLVAYLAGITEVNALPAHYRCASCGDVDFESGKGYGCGADMPDLTCPHCGASYEKEGFDIPFETFLGFGGDKVPDIDLNFSGEYQANAHRYTNELFGEEHVYRAGTIGTIAEKTAFGYVKKYLELIGKTVSRAEVNRLALGLVGVKRTTGQHPGGLVVIPQDMDITDFCPAQHPADDNDTNIVTTHFDYHCMEDNLLKLDELGHDDPTMIRMLEDITGLNARQIPLDDPETMALFSTPETLGLERGDEIIGNTGSIGIPEFGTGFTRGMLNDTKPEKFDTLVRLSGFSHGTDVWLGNAKDIIMSGTASIAETIGCRDDIMLYLISLGMDERFAFQIMEAVRKGRGLPDGAEDKMLALGVPTWYINSCKKIQYLFPKAHAVAYVMMAFRIAWFKVHRPLAFYSAYFYRRSQKDSFDASYMTQGIDAARTKIRQLRAAIDAKSATAKDEDTLTTLEACYEFYKRGFTFANIDLTRSDPIKFEITGETELTPPLIAVSGLGETAAYSIALNRGREFVSIEEFEAACTKVSKSHIEQLKSLGAFGDLPDSSQLSFF